MNIELNKYIETIVENNEGEYIYVDWSDDLEYKGTSKVLIKGKDLIKMIEKTLSSELISITPNQTREEALEEDIRILNYNVNVLKGRPQIYSLEQLILCMIDKIKKIYC